MESKQQDSQQESNQTTTGEWTAERMAKEYERLEKSVLDLSHPNFKMLTEQLAAEWSKYSKITHKWEQCVIEIQQLRKQLAAEREKWEAKEREVFADNARYIEQLREQLSAERGNTKQLMDVLKDIRVGAPDVVKQQIKYAQEKVGK